MISPSKLGRYHHLDSRGERGEIDSGGVEGFVKNEKKKHNRKERKDYSIYGTLCLTPVYFYLDDPAGNSLY